MGFVNQSVYQLPPQTYVEWNITQSKRVFYVYIWANQEMNGFVLADSPKDAVISYMNQFPNWNGHFNASTYKPNKPYYAKVVELKQYEGAAFKVTGTLHQYSLDWVN